MASTNTNVNKNSKENTLNKKKRSSKTKNKNNYDPKWKRKKEEIKEKARVEATKTLQEEKKALKKSISKKEGKRVDKEKLIDKYNIEKTVAFKLPSTEKLDEIYTQMQKKEEGKNQDNKYEPPKLRGKHFNFTSRVCTLVVMIILFLILCLIFIFKAIGYELGGSTTYSEYTSNDYSVCSKELGVYNNNCLSKDLNYSLNQVKYIHATFNYEALYSRSVSYKAKYYVVGRLNIYDKNSSSVVFTNNDTLIDSTVLNVGGEVVSFSTDVDIDFLSYRNLINDYISKNGEISSADLEVALYLKTDDIFRKVSFINIPLTEDTFMITSNNLDNQNQLIVYNEKNRTIDPFYIFIAVVCLIMDILLFTYLANFIYIVYHLDNKYNTQLKRILRDYDDIIVNATSEYTIPQNYRVVEVSSFKELLDARNSLEKPIVYEKINNIKCKFYVEDDKTIYLYKMKDEGI